MSGVGYLTPVYLLSADELETMVSGRRFRVSVDHSGGPRIARSATDTSAAARRRKTHYDRMD